MAGAHTWVRSDSLFVDATDEARGLVAADPTLATLRAGLSGVTDPDPPPAPPLLLPPAWRGDPGVDVGESAPARGLSKRPRWVVERPLSPLLAVAGASSGRLLRKMPPREACCMGEARLAAATDRGGALGSRRRVDVRPGAPVRGPAATHTSANRCATCLTASGAGLRRARIVYRSTVVAWPAAAPGRGLGGRCPTTRTKSRPFGSS